MKNFLTNNWFKFVVIILWVVTLSMGFKISHQILDGPQKPDTKEDCKLGELQIGNEDSVEWQCQRFQDNDGMGYNDWVRIYPLIQEFNQ